MSGKFQENTQFEKYSIFVNKIKFKMVFFVMKRNKKYIMHIKEIE